MSLCWWKSCSGRAVDDLLPWQYVEANGSGRTTINSQSMETERIFYTNWSAFPQFVDDVLGYSYLDNSVGPPKIVRVTPDVHPYINNCFAVSAEVEGDSISGTIPYNLPEDSGSSAFACLNTDFINYKKCMVKVKYARPTYHIGPEWDRSVPGSNTYVSANPYAPASPPAYPTVESELQRYVSIHPTFSGDYMRLDNKSPFRWCSNNQRAASINPNVDIDNTNPAVKIPITRINELITVEYVWREVPAIYDYAAGVVSSPFIPPQFNTIMRCLGKVNSIPFDPYNFNFMQYYDPTANGANFSDTTQGVPSGCALFSGVETTLEAPRLAQTNVYTWTIRYRFAIRMNTQTSFIIRNTFGIQVAGHQYSYNANQNWWDITTTGTDFSIPGSLKDLNRAGFFAASIMTYNPGGTVNPPSAAAIPPFQQTDLNDLFIMLG